MGITWMGSCARPGPVVVMPAPAGTTSTAISTFLYSIPGAPQHILAVDKVAWALKMRGILGWSAAASPRFDKPGGLFQHCRMPVRDIHSCAEIDWSVWSPTMKATLLFIFQGDQVLLMVKKRGLGAGKINAPGGKMDPGESAMQCAIRETEEELCIRASGVEPAGVLRFQFIDGLAIHCEVFRASGFDGVPTETDEGKPFWCAVDDIPYDRMWQDDQYWLPLMLAGRRFAGDFIFDGEIMRDHRLEILSGTES